MTGLDAFFPDFDPLTAPEYALTERLGAVRRLLASSKPVALDSSPRWIQER